MTAESAIGSNGADAVSHATEEPRQEQEMSFNIQQMEELRVHLWRRHGSATLRDAQVLSSSHHFIIIIFTNWEYLVDCKAGDWKPWGECSATCNGGTKTTERDVVQEPENGGAACPALDKTMACNTHGCPGSFLIPSFHHKYLH